MYRPLISLHVCLIAKLSSFYYYEPEPHMKEWPTATAAQLNQECSDEALHQLSTQIVGYEEYKHVLGLRDADINEIDKDPRIFHSSQNKFYAALLKWKNNSIDVDNPSKSTATYSQFVEIAKEVKDGKAIRKIHKACIKHTLSSKKFTYEIS